MGSDLIDRSWGGDSARADNVRLRARARRWKGLAKRLRAKLKRANADLAWALSAKGTP